MPVPLYGFLQGDTLGLLLVAGEQETIGALAARLREAASVRVEVPDDASIEVVYRGRRVAPELTVAEAGLAPHERFDVRRTRA
jgi:hypothetical protein